MRVLSSQIPFACAAIAAIAALVACSAAKTAPDPSATKPTVTAADLRNRDEPIERVLQRKAPGLAVTRVGNEIALQIRRSSSYKGTKTPPLHLLNGLRFTPGPGGLLSGINPEDIESVGILRDSDASLYGIDGANGVIAITTKKGGRP